MRKVGLFEGVQTLLGIGLVIYAGHMAHVHWSAGGIAVALAFGICGLVLIYVLWFCLATSSVWLVQVHALDTLMYTAISTARYPVSFFKGVVRALLTFVIPVAFATTFPTTALREGADYRLLVVGIAMAVSALVASNRFWTFALRHYSSASS